MDFGIARSTRRPTGSMTAGGAIVGTIEYMAPEQARGGTVDHRADIYAFGLDPERPAARPAATSGHTTAVAELMQRMQRTPESVALDRSVDSGGRRCAHRRSVCSRIRRRAIKRMQRSHRRPRSGPDGHGHPTPAVHCDRDHGADGRSFRRPRRSDATTRRRDGCSPRAWWSRSPRRRGPCASAVLAAPACLAGGLAGPAISLAIVPFRNASGDPTLDSLGSSLSQVLGTELGQSPRVRTVPSDRLHQVLAICRLRPNATLAPAELARVADFTNARRVLWGQYTRFGDADSHRRHASGSRSRAPGAAERDGARTRRLLAAISSWRRPSGRIWRAGSPDILQELKSTAWKPSTSSFEALRLYNEGMRADAAGHASGGAEELRSGDEAGRQLRARVFGARPHVLDARLRRPRRRSSRGGRWRSASALPPQEKYLIAANHYRITERDRQGDRGLREPRQGVAEQRDGAVRAGHACTSNSGTLDKAREQFTKVVALDPKFVEGLLALGRVEIRRGKPPGIARAPERRADARDSTEPRRSARQRPAGDRHRVQAARSAGGSAAALTSNRSRSGRSWATSAAWPAVSARSRRFRSGSASRARPKQSYREALKLQREIGNKSGTSTTLINLARSDNETLGPSRRRAAAAAGGAADPPRRRQSAPARRSCSTTSATSTSSKGDYSEAQTYFERTLEIREKSEGRRATLADTLHNLGETFTKMGRYEQALQRYLRALELRRDAGDKRGAAIESARHRHDLRLPGPLRRRRQVQGGGAAGLPRPEAARCLARRDPRRLRQQPEPRSGRLDEAVKPLDEALALAKDLQNPTLIAQILRFQADRLFYSGDAKGAVALAEQAIQAASQGVRPQLVAARAGKRRRWRAAVAAQPVAGRAVRQSRAGRRKSRAHVRSPSNAQSAAPRFCWRWAIVAAARQEADRTLAQRRNARLARAAGARTLRPRRSDDACRRRRGEA